jgi:hypothetical protein
MSAMVGIASTLYRAKSKAYLLKQQLLAVERESVNLSHETITILFALENTI